MATVGAYRSGSVASPTNPKDRIWAIDALRGLALFGVLTINLDTEFRRTLFEQFLPAPKLTAIDGGVSLFLSYALEFRAIALFSLLFGIGLAIQYERLSAKGLRTSWLVRRLIVLLGFGLIHLFLIWNGDILTEYAVAGLLVIPFLRIDRGFSLLAAFLSLILFAALPLFDLGSIIPPPEHLQSHIAQAQSIYSSGSLLDVVGFRIAEVPLILPLLTFVFPRTLALMLLGSWLWRSGAIARLSENRYGLTIGGIILVALGTMLTAQTRSDLVLFSVSPTTAHLIASSAPLLTAFGYACFVLAVSGSPRARDKIGWAVPVGRMAFSNYFAQSFALSVIFFGFGFGLSGTIGPALGLVIAVVIFAIQALVSAWWLRSHRFGPLEWLWRAFTYGEAPQWYLNVRLTKADAGLVE